MTAPQNLHGLRDALAQACSDPGIHAGPQGDRTTDQWRADAALTVLGEQSAAGWKPIDTAPSEPDCYHDLPGASDSGFGFATNADTGEIEYLLWWERTGHSSSIVTHWHPKLAGPSGRATLGERGGADG